VVDEIRVLRLLRSVTDDLAVLRAESAADDRRRADWLWLRGIKYTLVTAIEGCVDIAQHLCASEGWGPPRDNGDAVELLGRHGLLEIDLARRLRRAVGFRNVLVHEYIEVDDEIVLSRLKDLSDLDSFVAAVAEWVSTQSGRSQPNS
jgi:uncharacterized protein YutE (UPF0331/DUF86 family)